MGSVVFTSMKLIHTLTLTIISIISVKPQTTDYPDSSLSSFSDAIYDLQKTIERLADDTIKATDDIFSRLQYTDGQIVSMQSSIEALRAEQTQRTNYIQENLDYITGRDDLVEKFNATSSVDRILKNVIKLFQKQSKQLENLSKNQCSNFEKSLSDCKVIKHETKIKYKTVAVQKNIEPGSKPNIFPDSPSDNTDKVVIPGGMPKFHVDPTPKPENSKIPIIKPTVKSAVKNSPNSQCSGLISYSSAQKLFDHEQLDSRMKVSQLHEWTRTKIAPGKPGIGYTHEMPINTQMLWNYTFNFFKLTGEAEVGICLGEDLLPSVGESWLGNDKKAFSIYNGEKNDAKGSVWSKGKQILKSKNFKFVQGDEIIFSFRPCPDGEVWMVKNGKQIAKTKFKIRGETKFRFCASLTQTGDIIYRSLWGLLDLRLH